jgi:polyhydroxybutyrate depolymerase
MEVDRNGLEVLSRDEVRQVLALHGHGWNSKDMEKYSGMDKEADKEGFIVAYPDATRWLDKKELSAWDTGNGLLPKGAKVNDIGFLRTIIDTTQGQMNIDPRRIYAMGE